MSGSSGATGGPGVPDPDPAIRRAVVFTPMASDLRVLVDAAVLAESLGYEAVIVPEGWGLDATTVLAAAAARTERIRLVAGVLSVWGRSAGTLAMAAASLDALSGGRVTLGLGASTPVLAERFHDVAFTDPVGRLRRVATDVRTLLAGGRIPVARHERGLRLGQPPRPDLPIWVAGLGPRAVAAATEVGDAWFPAMIPRDRMAGVRAAALAPARHGVAVGRHRAVPEVVSGPLVAPDGVDGPGRPMAEQLLGWYLTGMGPSYAAQAARLGYADAVEALRTANPRPRPGQLAWPGAADPLLDQLAAVGSSAEVADQVATWDPVADLVAVLVGPGSRDAVLAAVAAAAPPAPSLAGAGSGVPAVAAGPGR